MIYDKDPDAILDYEKDISAWLTGEGSDTVASFTVTADAGITVASSAGGTFASTYTVSSPTTDEQAGTLIYWVSGGTVGQRYGVTIHVTTAADREEDFSDTFTITQH